MINVSNSFKEELNNDNRDYMCYVDIVLVNPGDVVESYLQDSSGEYILDSSGENINTFFDGVVISLTNENLWSSALSIEESVSNQNSFDVGSVIINKATIVINNIYEDYTSYDFTGAKVTIRIGLQLSNGTIEVVNKGIFYVDSATYNGSLITLECLDSMSKFDKDYSESELIYPATLRQIVQDACSVCGVLYSASIFENDTFVVNERPSDESLTFRQMLNYVGQIACQQFSIDHNDRLIARWYDRDMMDDLYSSPSSVDDSEYHQISSINSQNISQDDVIITGVKVTEFSEDTENPGGSYLSGTTGYVIEIKDNKLIPIGKGSGVSTYLGQKLVGMRFRPMELTFQNDPTIEPTDIAEVIDFKGNHFYTFITSTNFTVGNTQTLSCGAESPTRNSASRYSAATQAYTNSKKLVEKEKTERELAVEALNNALSNASGMYTTEERQSDGSVITYLHDKPTLEESQNVIMITAEAIGISNDGGETYPYGLFLTGDLIARLLYVVGINADYINSGAITVADNDGEITFFADTETGRVDIKAYSLTITGKTVEEIAGEESEAVMNDFVDAVYTPTITNLQNQIDGQIETWFYNYIPTAENYPASEWTTDTEKDKHLGDLFYVVDNTEYGGQAYRWAKIGTDYLWDYVEDTAVVKALADAAAAQDTADQKRRVFVVTPYPPYDVGDLWVGDDTSEMMRCQVSRQSGNYVSTDWIKAVKYTDDTELYNFIQNDYADTIQEIYNSVDQKSETWYQPEDPSLNWTDTESVSLADVSGDSIIDVSGEEIFTVFESEKFKHEGDLWKDSDTNIEYIYKGGTWVEMPIPDAVFDEIDGKAQIFVVQPTPPYNIGDTWFTGTTILVCNTARNSGVFVSSDWTKKDNYTDDSALYDFIEGDYAKTIEEIQAQTDQKAETWYQSTDPSSNWTTDEKAGHAGDLWYNTTEQKTYIYNGSAWDETKSTPPDEVFDSIDGKAQIFVSTPAPPYSVGDLWFDSASSDIMTCIYSRESGNFNAGDWQKRNKYTDDSALQNFLSGEYLETITELKTQADKKAETWYQGTDPSTSWNATQKTEHEGDLWYNTSNQKTYIYDGSAWQETKSTPPDEVFDSIDGKAQIFITQPTPPYSSGDLWFNSDTSDIMTCINSRDNGSYNEGDWQKRNKYTDDTAVEELDESLNQQEVFDRLTNGGTAQGIYIKDEQLYINGTYISIDDLVSLNAKIGGWDINESGIYNEYTIEDIKYRVFLQRPTGQYNYTNDFIGIHAIDDTGEKSYNVFAIDANGRISNVSPERNKAIYINGGQISFVYPNSNFPNYIRASILPLDLYGDVGISIYVQTPESERPRYIHIYAENTENNGDLSLVMKVEGDINVEGNAHIGTSLSVPHISTDSINVSGSKSRIVNTCNYGILKQYCYEMASPIFGDIGEAQTDDNGECYIFLDDLFGETVNSECEYQVFLQKEGPGDLWVDEKKSNYFVIKGTENLKFAWEIKVPQKDYETERLENYDENFDNYEEYNYSDEAAEMVNTELESEIESLDDSVEKELNELEEIINEEINKFYSS